MVSGRLVAFLLWLCLSQRYQYLHWYLYLYLYFITLDLVTCCSYLSRRARTGGTLPWDSIDREAVGAFLLSWDLLQQVSWQDANTKLYLYLIWRKLAMGLDRSGGWWGLPAVMGLFVRSRMTGCKCKNNQNNQDNQDNQDNWDKDMEFVTSDTR